MKYLLVPALTALAHPALAHHLEEESAAATPAEGAAMLAAAAAVVVVAIASRHAARHLAGSFQPDR